MKSWVRIWKRVWLASLLHLRPSFYYENCFSFVTLFCAGVCGFRVRWRSLSNLHPTRRSCSSSSSSSYLLAETYAPASSPQLQDRKEVEGDPCWAWWVCRAATRSDCRSLFGALLPQLAPMPLRIGLARFFPVKLENNSLICLSGFSTSYFRVPISDLELYSTRELPNLGSGLTLNPSPFTTSELSAHSCFRFPKEIS